MFVHRGEAWVDSICPRNCGVPDSKASSLDPSSISVQFDERATVRPEQILATAHAASYCVALWNRLKQAGHQPRHLHTTAYVHVDEQSTPGMESEIFLDADADVPGMNDARFALHARAAKTDFVALRGLSGIPVRVEPHLHA